MPEPQGGREPVVAKSSAIPDSADQVVFGSSNVLTDRGVNKGVLLSDTAFVYDDGTRLEFRRVQFTFYTSTGLKDGVMTARSAVYNPRLSRLEARGDVVVTRDDSKRLTSQQLVYDQAAQPDLHRQRLRAQQAGEAVLRHRLRVGSAVDELEVPARLQGCRAGPAPGEVGDRVPMHRRSARRRLLLVAVPALLAGCFGGRRQGPPAAVPAPGDSAATAQKADSVRDSVRKVTADSLKTALDTAAVAARADSAARAAKAGRDSTTRKDSSAAKAPRKAAPTSRPCVLDFNESPPETRLRYQRLPDSTALTFIGGGFVAHCQGENSRIRADSAEQFEASGIVNLFGNVSYEDPGKMRLEAQHATYFTREERVFADGNVVATQLASGSTFRGSSIEYLRPLPGSRPYSKLIAPNRPTLQMIEKDSTGKPGPPVNVTANTMVDDADSLLFAWGDVQITRTTLIGESDSASFDKVTERARLIRSARIVNRDDKQPFRMTGDTIDLYSKDRKLERVVALHNGNASSNDVVMQAERIDLRFIGQQLDRAYAFGSGRAKATTASQLLVADSIAVRMPDQRVRTVMAVRLGGGHGRAGHHQDQVGRSGRAARRHGHRLVRLHGRAGRQRQKRQDPGDPRPRATPARCSRLPTRRGPRRRRPSTTSGARRFTSCSIAARCATCQ